MSDGVFYTLIVVSTALWIFIYMLANSTLNSMRSMQQYLRSPAEIRANQKKQRLQKSARDIAGIVIGLEVVRMVSLLIAGRNAVDAAVSLLALVVMLGYFIQSIRAQMV